jgi:carbonic anhydrase
MDFKKIFQNNEKWIQDKLNLDPDYFAKLSQGQSPQILYIGCSDSRVTTEELMGAQPGEIFIHRNIANMVISIDLNVMAVINFAVRNLKVKHIVVCGHYECGGIKAAMTPTDIIRMRWTRSRTLS